MRNGSKHESLSPYFWDPTWPPTLHSIQVDSTIVVVVHVDLRRSSGSVTSAERTKLLNQKGVTIWLTGLSASGKVCITHSRPSVDLTHLP